MPGFRPMGRMGRALGAPKRSAASLVGLAFTSSVVFGAGSPQGFTDPGTYNFTVPGGVTLLRAKGWGAPGGTGGTIGGPGGYVEVDIPVTPGEVLTVILPSAGNGATAGSPGGGTGGYLGGAGGGFAAIKRGSTFLFIAPGGGGGGDGARGGPGGGLIGGDGVSTNAALTASKNGKGGTQTAGGLDGDGTGPTAAQYQGANYYQGGAGGGGLYGGGSGALLAGVGRGAGGGGSAYTHPTMVATNIVMKGDTDPPKTDDPNYGGNAGRPGLGYGRIVILY